MSKKRLGKKVRQTAKKEGFLPRLEAIHGSKAKVFLTVMRSGIQKATFGGFYLDHALDIQNKREWDRASCLKYDNIMWEVVASEFGDRALEDLDEFDFLDKWDKIESKLTSEAKLKDAFTMVRLVAKYAYDIGAIAVSLEGILPEEWSEPLRKSRKPDDKQEVKRLVEKGLRIRPSLPLATVLKLHLTLLSLIDCFGQALGGSIIYTLGDRTSELLMFQYKHLIEVEPGKWALLRLDETHVGKTSNAPRWHFLPRFLTKILLLRREKLQKLFPTEDIGELHIVCFGTDYRRPVTLQEFNSFMKNVYLEIGVKQDVLSAAYSSIRESAETLKRYERSLTAYLGRHQVITEMVASGLSEAYLCFFAGHAQIDPYMEPYDFSNPDEYQKMWDALNRRPIIQILDHIAEYDEFQISGGTASFLSDSFVKVTFKTEAEKVFLINAYGREVNTPIDATDISNLEVLSQVPTILEKEPDYSHTISIRHKLWERGQAALERVKNAFNSPATERILAIEDSVWLESSNNLEAVLSIEAPPALSPSVDTSTTHSTRPLYAAQNTSNDSKKHEKTPIAIDKSFYFYVADTKGRLISIGKESFKPQKRGTLGKRVASKAAHCSSLYAYRTNELAFLLSTDGYLHRILVGTFLGESQYADILRNGGLLLQSSALTSPGSSLVCLTSDGGLISVSINSLAGSFPAQGLPIMKKELATSGKTIVAACICPANTDVLLVTKKGHALRIKHSKMSVHKSLFLTPTKGIKLMDGDEPAACCPFTAQGVLGVSAHGQALRISGEFSIPAQNPGSSGVAFMKLDPGDSILDVLDSSAQFIAMIREDGYLCCTSLDGFPVQGRNSKGVRAMVTTSNSERHPIVAAISL